MNSYSKITVSYALPQLATRAYQLADQLNVTLDDKNEMGYILQVTERGLLLQAPKSLGFRDFLLDYTHGNYYRRLVDKTQSNLLAKAIGSHLIKSAEIIDATGGLAMDALSLALRGARMLVFERSLVIFALITDAFSRAKMKDIIFNHLQIQFLAADAIEYLAHATSVDIIYLDPMYPLANTSALNKKELRMLRSLVGEDTDANILFEWALMKARLRVIVKRPLHETYLCDKIPHHSIKGKAVRFDVYCR